MVMNLQVEGGEFLEQLSLLKLRKIFRRYLVRDPADH
jgi:hypothetical protein